MKANPLKYSSQTRTENLAQFWSQSKPFKRDREGEKPPFYINGKPHRIKSYTISRRTHFNAVEERTRCALYLLSTLPVGEYRYFRGCIRMPGSTPDEWKRLKKVFSKKLHRYCAYHQVEIRLDCKLHITVSRGDDKPYSDDIHFDYILYTNLDWGERRLGKLLRGFLVDAASMTCGEVSERELPGAVSYVYKCHRAVKTGHWWAVQNRPF